MKHEPNNVEPTIYNLRISEIGVQEILKSENLEPEIAVFEKAENGNLNARKLSATEI